jgi:hypothetical protein
MAAPLFVLKHCRRHLEMSLFPPVRNVTFSGVGVAAFPGCGVEGVAVSGGVRSPK